MMNLIKFLRVLEYFFVKTKFETQEKKYLEYLLKLRLFSNKRMIVLTNRCRSKKL